MVLLHVLFFTHDQKFQNDLPQRVFGVARTSAPQLRCIFSWGTHFRSIHECLSILCITLNVLKSSWARQMTDHFRKFHYFSLNFYRISLIFIDFCWFSLIFLDFHWLYSNFSKVLSTFWWCWATQIGPRSSQTVLKDLKMESSCKNTSKLWCGSPLDSKYSQR